MQSQQTNLHKNTFAGALNKDSVKNLVSNDQYFDAQNITLVDNNKFLSLENISGTTNLGSIITDSSAVVLGVFASKYKIGSISGINCLTIITAVPSGNFNIFCFDVDNNVLYKLYQEVTPSDYFNNDGHTITGVLYPENGLDIIYFTDFENEVRKLRCEVPTGSPDNFLTSFDISLTRHGALGHIDIAALTAGGSLLCGTYQFAYQLIIPTTNRYTKWSLLSLPFEVFNTSNNYPFSAVGASTDRKITLNIYPSEEELETYTHFRLAVVENIYPEGVNNLQAAITDVFPIASYLNGGYINNFPVINNLQGSTQVIPIDEIVIDLAAIETVKTLVVKKNRLIGGNVKYKNTVYDNGDITISGGSILKLTPNDTNSILGVLQKKGYFRNEVYRYAISYFDTLGNFSSPQVLNLENVTGNQIPDTIPIIFGPELFQDPNFVSSFTYWKQVPLSGDNFWTTPSGQFKTHYSVPGLDQTANIIYQDVAGLIAGSSLRISGQIGSIDVKHINSYDILLYNSGGLDTTINVVAPDPEFFSHDFTLPSGIVRIGIQFNLTTSFFATDMIMQLCSLKTVSIPRQTKDFKFPDRSQQLGSENYSILDSSNKPVSLGLRLSGIDHHPSWAKGFVLLRAKRKENIIWQSPMIPMVSIYGIGALDNYPVKAKEQPAALVDVNYPNAQPMGPDTTYFPMNYFYNTIRSIDKVTTSGGSGLNLYKAGEVQFAHPSGVLDKQSLMMVFPPQTMYTGNSKYVFNEGHQLQTVDSTLVSLTGYHFGPTVASPLGTYLNTSVTGTFHAMTSKQYYYDYTHAGMKVSIRGGNNFKIKGYRDFDNLSEGFVLNGKEIFKKENLETATIKWEGYDGQNIQRGAVIDLNEFASVSSPSATNSINLTYASGSKQGYSGSDRFAPFTDGVVDDGENEIEIVNCVAGLSDDRYGLPNTFHEYIYTGTSVIFTEAELPTIRSKGSLPKTVDVWGGDCVVSRHFFKIADTTYGIVNANKIPGIGRNVTTTVTDWTRAFVPFSADAPIMMPVQFKNCAQYTEIYLESKFNGELVEQHLLDNSGAYTDPKIPRTESTCRTPLIYNSNINSIKEDDQKIFVTLDPLIPNVLNTKARLVYSDQKIYQSGIEGFDIFRVLNFYDMDETYGAINNLSLISNDLYALQDSAIAYVGAGEKVLEQTDGSQLAVRSGDVIGNIILLDTKRGCQNLSSVVNTGRTLYFVDQYNKGIYSLSNRQLQIVSDFGMQSEVRNLLSTSHKSNDLIGIYDQLRKEYWFISKPNTKCYIFNENFNKWISNYDFQTIQGGIFLNKNLYPLGIDNIISGISAYSMYTGLNNHLFGRYVTPSVNFIVNPENEFGKTFDELSLVATDRLSSLNLVVPRESSLTDQTVSNIDLTLVETRGEGNYRVKTLLDSNNARLRGNYMNTQVVWITGVDNKKVTLPSVLTKYRQSQNIF